MSEHHVDVADAAMEHSVFEEALHVGHPSGDATPRNYPSHNSPSTVLPPDPTLVHHDPRANLNSTHEILPPYSCDPQDGVAVHSDEHSSASRSSKFITRAGSSTKRSRQSRGLFFLESR